MRSYFIFVLPGRFQSFNRVFKNKMRSIQIVIMRVISVHGVVKPSDIFALVSI